MNVRIVNYGGEEICSRQSDNCVRYSCHRSVVADGADYPFVLNFPSTGFEQKLLELLPWKLTLSPGDRSLCHEAVRELFVSPHFSSALFAVPKG